MEDRENGDDNVAISTAPIDGDDIPTNDDDDEVVDVGDTKVVDAGDATTDRVSVE